MLVAVIVAELLIAPGLVCYCSIVAINDT